MPIMEKEYIYVNVYMYICFVDGVQEDVQAETTTVVGETPDGAVIEGKEEAMDAIATAENAEPVGADTEAVTEEEPPKPKELTELEKYWKAVKDNPSDFTGWTYLLQYVEQEIKDVSHSQSENCTTNQTRKELIFLG